MDPGDRVNRCEDIQHAFQSGGPICTTICLVYMGCDPPLPPVTGVILKPGHPLYYWQTAAAVAIHQPYGRFVYPPIGEA